MNQINNEKIIDILKNLSILLEIKGENPFKARAYSNAANLIEVKNIDVIKEINEGTLSEIKGFGKALVSKLTELVNNGKLEYYEKLKQEIPLTLIDLTKIGGLGPKKVNQIWKKLNITTVEALEKACLNGELKNLKGFTEKTEEMILNGIEHKKASKGRFIQQSVKKQAEDIWKILSELKEVEKVAITGEIRRFTETIKELNFIIGYKNFENLDETCKLAIQNYCSELEIVDNLPDSYILKGITSLKVPITFRFVPFENYYIVLHQTTGNDEYIKSFNKYLEQNNFRIIDNHFFKDSTKITINSEKELYSIIKLQYVEPELRESTKPIEIARQNQLPKLIEVTNLKGMIHVHSNWTDGQNSIREMALKSKELGFEYMVLCDHSQSAAYANGLTKERVKLQQKEIDKLNNENLGIKIIKGIESDILNDGSLDYDEETLKSFDIVIASIHSGFRMTKSEMTKRIITALKNPYTTILGHPTGRLLTVRPGYDLDMKQVIDCASDYGKIIEINSNPYRLDISWENLLYAKEIGMKTSINPDSHRTSSLTDIFIGVNVARKAWYEAKDVINTYSYEDFLKNIVKK